VGENVRRAFRRLTLYESAMAKRLCIRGPLDGQWQEVLDGQPFFPAPKDGGLLYSRRKFMAVGGKGHVEVYAPKDVMSDNEALEALVARYGGAAVPVRNAKPEKKRGR